MDKTELPMRVRAVIEVWRTTAHYRSRYVELDGLYLTHSEFTCLVLTASGISYKRQSEFLGRSIKTIEKHADSLRRKTKIHTINGLTHLAIKHNLVTAGEFVEI